MATDFYGTLGIERNASDADIKRAITQGIRPDGTKLRPTMAFAWYKNIAPSDLEALVAYLRSMKPQKTR